MAKGGYDPVDYLAELYRRERLQQPKDQELLGLLFEKQKIAVESKATRQTWRCSRRAGKTYAVMVKHLLTAERYPNSVTAYCALTRPTAKRLVWGFLKQLDSKLKLGYRFNETELVATAPSGGEIWLIGAQKDDEREKMRGHAFRGVTLDEAGSYGPFLEPFIREVIGPALSDYNGWLLLTGTPPPNPVGAFYEADAGSWRAYERHHWTVRDNCFFPRWRDKKDWRQESEKFLQEKLDEYGWTPEHPSFRREYLGEWCVDTTARVYDFIPDRNIGKPPEDLDPTKWQYFWGVDIGFEDAMAIWVWGWHPSHPQLWEIYSESTEGLTTDDLGKRLVKLKELYPPSVAVGDSGGLGKLILQDLWIRYGIHLMPASKADKPGHIKMMNADLQQGLLKVRPNSPIIDQMSVLPWDIEHYGKLEDARYSNDLCDAALYAWRHARHFYWNPERPPEDTGPEAKINAFWEKELRKIHFAKTGKKR